MSASKRVARTITVEGGIHSIDDCDCGAGLTIRNGDRLIVRHTYTGELAHRVSEMHGDALPADPPASEHIGCQFNHEHRHPECYDDAIPTPPASEAVDAAWGALYLALWDDVSPEAWREADKQHRPLIEAAIRTEGLGVERLARALPDWAVQHPLGMTEEQLRLHIASGILERLGR